MKTDKSIPEDFTIPKRHQKIEPEVILNYLFYIILLIIIMTSMFDFSITVYSMKVYGDDFFMMEGNQLFLWSEKIGIPTYLNLSVMFQIFLIAFSGDIYIQYLKKRTRFWALLLIASLTCNIVLSIGHTVGGFSWLFI